MRAEVACRAGTWVGSLLNANHVQKLPWEAESNSLPVVFDVENLMNRFDFPGCRNEPHQHRCPAAIVFGIT